MKKERMRWGEEDIFIERTTFRRGEVGRKGERKSGRDRGRKKENASESKTREREGTRERYR